MLTLLTSTNLNNPDPQLHLCKKVLILAAHIFFAKLNEINLFLVSSPVNYEYLVQDVRQ